LSPRCSSEALRRAATPSPSPTSWGTASEAACSHSAAPPQRSAPRLLAAATPRAAMRPGLARLTCGAPGGAPVGDRVRCRIRGGRALRVPPALGRRAARPRRERRRAAARAARGGAGEAQGRGGGRGAAGALSAEAAGCEVLRNPRLCLVRNAHDGRNEPVYACPSSAPTRAAHTGTSCTPHPTRGMK
jgi:hypothetical protein